MQVQLILDGPARKGQVIPVHAPGFTIGNEQGCSLRSGSSNISPQHCKINIEGKIVSIQDLHSETGTFVNGERILFPKVLKDGDKIAVGKLVFIVQIKLPEVFETEDDPGLLFDIKIDGQKMSVTKSRLFRLAQKGDISPDDIITVCGTKVFADTIDGIVFDNKSAESNTPPAYAVLPQSSHDFALVPSPPESEPDIHATASGIYGFFKNELDSAAGYTPPAAGENKATQNAAPQKESVQDQAIQNSAAPVESVDAIKAADPFGIQDQPSAIIVRPPKAAKSVLGEIGEKIAPLLEKVDTPKFKIWLEQNKKYYPYVLGTLCLLLGFSGVFLFWGESSPPEIYYVQGTLTLDGKPVEGANVLMHPQSEDGESAGGITDARGRFTVTTGMAPVGSGAKEGMYEITFLKTEREGKGLSPAEISRRFGNRRLKVTYLIPQKYNNPKTSEIKPINVTAEGSNKFSFELFSQNTAAFDRTPRIITASKIEDNPNDGNITDKGPPQPGNNHFSPEIIEKPPESLFPNIFAAISRGSLEGVADFITRRKTDINSRTPQGYTVLQYAIRVNASPEMIKYILNAGADVNTKDQFGNTLLILAIIRNYQADVLDLLLTLGAGADVNTEDQAGFSPLHHAAANNASRKVIRSLLDYDASIHAQDESGRTPLHWVLRREPNIGTVQDFLDCNADVNSTDYSGNTLLHVAAEANSRNHRDEEAMRLLISQGADINACNHSGKTPLDLASNEDKRKILLAKGAKQNVAPPQNTTKTPEEIKPGPEVLKDIPADMQYRIGMQFYFGTKEIPQDRGIALEWLYAAAQRGHAEAQFRVGTYYYFGWEVAKHEGEAVSWLKKAAEQNQRDAKSLLKDIEKKKDIFRSEK